MKYALPLALALAFVACDFSSDDDTIAGPGNALAPFLDLSAVVIESDCHDETARYRLDAVVVWPEGKPAGVNVLSRTFSHTDGWSEKIYGQGSASHEVQDFTPGAWTVKGMLSNGTPILPDALPAEPRQDAECS